MGPAGPPQSRAQRTTSGLHEDLFGPYILYGRRNLLTKQKEVLAMRAAIRRIVGIKSEEGTNVE